jgi:hypothetical protein
MSGSTIGAGRRSCTQDKHAGRAADFQDETRAPRYRAGAVLERHFGRLVRLDLKVRRMWTRLTGSATCPAAAYSSLV